MGDTVTVTLSPDVAAAVVAVAQVDGTDPAVLVEVAVAGWLTSHLPAFTAATDALARIPAPAQVDPATIAATTARQVNDQLQNHAPTVARTTTPPTDPTPTPQDHPTTVARADEGAGDDAVVRSFDGSDEWPNPCARDAVVLDDGLFHCLTDGCDYGGGRSAHALMSHLRRSSAGHRFEHEQAVAETLGVAG